MKRYMLFSGDTYYSDGGAEDFVKSFDTPDEALGYVGNLEYKEDWWHIFDADECIIIEHS